MEIRVIIFLFFVFVTVTSNTLVVWFVYKAFSTVTSKVTETVSEFERSSETRAWIDSLHKAAAEAAAVTEATKQKMAEFEPVLSKAHQDYSRTLAKVDSKLEEAAEEVEASAQKMRDVVAKPAVSIMAFAAGFAKVIEHLGEEE
jgi:biopolymer transport protein ExbB/TolQ